MNRENAPHEASERTKLEQVHTIRTQVIGVGLEALELTLDLIQSRIAAGRPLVGVSTWLPTLSRRSRFAAGLEQRNAAARFGALPGCACMRRGRSRTELRWGIIIFDVVVKGVWRRRRRWRGDMSRSLRYNSNASLRASWPSLLRAPPCANPHHGAPAYHSATHVLPPRGSRDAPPAHTRAQQPICMRCASLRVQRALLRPRAWRGAGHAQLMCRCCWCWSRGGRGRRSCQQRTLLWECLRVCTQSQWEMVNLQVQDPCRYSQLVRRVMC
jgi:hypothetical protein